MTTITMGDLLQAIHDKMILNYVPSIDESAMLSAEAQGQSIDSRTLAASNQAYHLSAQRNQRQALLQPGQNLLDLSITQLLRQYLLFNPQAPPSDSEPFLGNDLNIQSVHNVFSGGTLLMAACQFHCLDAIKWLFDQGVDCRLQHLITRHTALSLLCSSTNFTSDTVDIIQLLLQYMHNEYVSSRTGSILRSSLALHQQSPEHLGVVSQAVNTSEQTTIPNLSSITLSQNRNEDLADIYYSIQLVIKTAPLFNVYHVIALDILLSSICNILAIQDIENLIKLLPLRSNYREELKSPAFRDVLDCLWTYFKDIVLRVSTSALQTTATSSSVRVSTNNFFLHGNSSGDHNLGTTLPGSSNYTHHHYHYLLGDTKCLPNLIVSVLPDVGFTQNSSANSLLTREHLIYRDGANNLPRGQSSSQAKRRGSEVQSQNESTNAFDSTSKSHHGYSSPYVPSGGGGKYCQVTYGYSTLAQLQTIPAHPATTPGSAVTTNSTNLAVAQTNSLSGSLGIVPQNVWIPGKTSTGFQQQLHTASLAAKLSEWHYQLLYLCLQSRIPHVTMIRNCIEDIDLSLVYQIYDPVYLLLTNSFPRTNATRSILSYILRKGFALASLESNILALFHMKQLSATKFRFIYDVSKPLPFFNTPVSGFPSSTAPGAGPTTQGNSPASPATPGVSYPGSVADDSKSKQDTQQSSMSSTFTKQQSTLGSLKLVQSPSKLDPSMTPTTTSGAPGVWGTSHTSDIMQGIVCDLTTHCDESAGYVVSFESNLLNRLEWFNSVLQHLVYNPHVDPKTLEFMAIYGGHTELFPTFVYHYLDLLINHSSVERTIGVFRLVYKFSAQAHAIYGSATVVPGSAAAKSAPNAQKHQPFSGSGATNHDSTRNTQPTSTYKMNPNTITPAMFIEKILIKFTTQIPKEVMHYYLYELYPVVTDHDRQLIIYTLRNVIIKQPCTIYNDVYNRLYVCIEYFRRNGVIFSHTLSYRGTDTTSSSGSAAAKNVKIPVSPTTSTSPFNTPNHHVDSILYQTFIKHGYFDAPGASDLFELLCTISNSAPILPQPLVELFESHERRQNEVQLLDSAQPTSTPFHSGSQKPSLALKQLQVSGIAPEASPVTTSTSLLRRREREQSLSSSGSFYPVSNPLVNTRSLPTTSPSPPPPPPSPSLSPPPPPPLSIASIQPISMLTAHVLSLQGFNILDLPSTYRSKQTLVHLIMLFYQSLNTPPTLSPQYSEYIVYYQHFFKHGGSNSHSMALEPNSANSGATSRRGSLPCSVELLQPVLHHVYKFGIFDLIPLYVDLLYVIECYTKEYLHPRGSGSSSTVGGLVNNTSGGAAASTSPHFRKFSIKMPLPVDHSNNSHLLLQHYHHNHHNLGYFFNSNKPLLCECTIINATNIALEQNRLQAAAAAAAAGNPAPNGGATANNSSRGSVSLTPRRGASGHRQSGSSSNPTAGNATAAPATPPIPRRQCLLHPNNNYILPFNTIGSLITQIVSYGLTDTYLTVFDWGIKIPIQYITKQILLVLATEIMNHHNINDINRNTYGLFTSDTLLLFDAYEKLLVRERNMLNIHEQSLDYSYTLVEDHLLILLIYILFSRVETIRDFEALNVVYQLSPRVTPIPRHILDPTLSSSSPSSTALFESFNILWKQNRSQYHDTYAQEHEDDGTPSNASQNPHPHQSSPGIGISSLCLTTDATPSRSARLHDNDRGSLEFTSSGGAFGRVSSSSANPHQSLKQSQANRSSSGGYQPLSSHLPHAPSSPAASTSSQTPSIFTTTPPWRSDSHNPAQADGELTIDPNRSRSESDASTISLLLPPYYQQDQQRHRQQSEPTDVYFTLIVKCFKILLLISQTTHPTNTSFFQRLLHITLSRLSVLHHNNLTKPQNYAFYTHMVAVCLSFGARCFVISPIQLHQQHQQQLQQQSTCYSPELLDLYHGNSSRGDRANNKDSRSPSRRKAGRKDDNDPQQDALMRHQQLGADQHVTGYNRLLRGVVGAGGAGGETNNGAGGDSDYDDDETDDDDGDAGNTSTQPADTNILTQTYIQPINLSIPEVDRVVNFYFSKQLCANTTCISVTHALACHPSLKVRQLCFGKSTFNQLELDYLPYLSFSQLLDPQGQYTYLTPDHLLPVPRFSCKPDSSHPMAIPQELSGLFASSSASSASTPSLSSMGLFSTPFNSSCLSLPGHPLASPPPQVLSPNIELLLNDQKQLDITMLELYFKHERKQMRLPIRPSKAQRRQYFGDAILPHPSGRKDRRGKGSAPQKQQQQQQQGGARALSPLLDTQSTNLLQQRNATPQKSGDQQSESAGLPQFPHSSKFPTYHPFRSYVQDQPPFLLWYILNTVSCPSEEDILFILNHQSSLPELRQRGFNNRHNQNNETILMHAILRRWNEGCLLALFKADLYDAFHELRSSSDDIPTGPGNVRDSSEDGCFPPLDLPPLDPSLPIHSIAALRSVLFHADRDGKMLIDYLDYCQTRSYAPLFAQVIDYHYNYLLSVPDFSPLFTPTADNTASPPSLFTS